MTRRLRSFSRSKTGVILAIAGALLLAGLVTWAGVLVVRSCGLNFGPLGLLDACPRPQAVSADIVAELEYQERLRERVNGLQLRLATLPHCPPPEPPPQPPPAPPPPDTDTLDAEKWDEQDISLLGGCWSLASDYSIEHIDTGEITDVASWEMCFDDQGEGTQELVFSDGATCSEEVVAAFLEDGRLRINDQDDVSCSDSSFIYRRTMTCQLDPDGEAACQSQQLELDDTIHDVRIVRRTSP